MPALRTPPPSIRSVGLIVDVPSLLMHARISGECYSTCCTESCVCVCLDWLCLGVWEQAFNSSC